MEGDRRRAEGARGRGKKKKRSDLLKYESPSKPSRYPEKNEVHGLPQGPGGGPYPTGIQHGGLWRSMGGGGTCAQRGRNPSLPAGMSNVNFPKI